MFNWYRTIWLMLICSFLMCSEPLAAKSSMQDNKKSSFSSVLQKAREKVSFVKRFVSDVTKKFDNWITEQADSIEDGVSVFWQVLFAFLAGLSVSFTPCVYPLIPITIGTLGSRNAIGAKMQFARAIFYLLGIAVVFATLGFLATHFNWIFGSWAGNKWVILGTVIVFSFLALTMLDLVEFEYSLALKAPEVTSLSSALLYGMVMGLVASPCMTPALLTLLGVVAQQNSSLLGFVLLFSFALGMSFLIILLSCFSNLLLLMPKPGFWMVEFRHLLGFGILFLCMQFLQPIISSWQYYLLLGCLWAFIFFYYFFSSKKESVSRIIIAHQNKSGETALESSHLGISEFVSLSFFFKKTFSLLALFFAIFYIGKSYLVFNRTRLRHVLVKLLR